MTTATRKQFVARCKALGVGYDTFGGAVEIIAPDGLVFSATANHTHRYSLATWQGMPKPEAYAAALDDMSGGIAACVIVDCEWCADTGLPYEFSQDNERNAATPRVPDRKPGVAYLADMEFGGE